MSNVEMVKGYIPGSIGRVAELHGTYYHEHWDFSEFFEAKVATELSEFLGRYDEKISLLKKLLTFVETKHTGGYISGLLTALTLQDTSTRRVVLNSLKNTKEYSGVERLTNSDLNCHSNSLTSPKCFFVKKEGFLKDLSNK